MASPIAWLWGRLHITQDAAPWNESDHKRDKLGRFAHSASAFIDTVIEYLADDGSKIVVGGDEGVKLYNDIIHDRDSKITLKELQEHPLIKLADEKLAKRGGNTTDKINTPERQSMREEWAQKIINGGSFSGIKDDKENFDGEIKKEFRAEVVIGPPAAGKSSVIVNPQSQKHGARILDSDDIKKLIPEFDNGDGAGTVHEESSQILENMVLPEFTHGAHKGDNIIIPLTGKTVATPQRFIKALLNAGYKVHISFNDVTEQNSAKRAVTRYLHKNRFLSPSFIGTIGNKPKKTYDTLKELYGDKIESFRHMDNNVPHGQEPIEVEYITNAELKNRPFFELDNGGL